MKFRKVFGTEEMSQRIFEYLVESGSFVRDGFGAYTVGAYVKEARESSDPESYPLDEIAIAQHTDEWFIANGALDGEEVIVAHGSAEQQETS